MQTTNYNKPFILNRADPYIYRHEDGTYYFTATVPEYDRIILRRSDTLQGLKTAQEKTLWTKRENGIMSKHIWAPELHYLSGKWHIYFAAGDADNIWEIRPYVLECKGQNPMEDGWADPMPMKASAGDKTSFTGFSLDATVFSHKNTDYIIWAEKPREITPPISNLYIAPLADTFRLAAEPTLLTTPAHDWETIEFAVNEGPAVIKRDGKIFMTFSASSTGACYCMGMISVSEDADIMDAGAWQKLGHPVYATDAAKGIYGPGHNSFTKSKDGRDICVYHARTYEKIEGDPLNDPNRHTMLLEIKWENDFPVFKAATAEEQAGY